METEPCSVCRMPIRPRREYQPPVLCSGCFNVQLELPRNPKDFEVFVERFREYRRQTHKLWKPKV